MNRRKATWSTQDLKQNIQLFGFTKDYTRSSAWISRCDATVAIAETELFARGELEEWECQAMLASFLLPSDKLPADLRKFREAPEGGSGLERKTGAMCSYYDVQLGKRIDYEEMELLPTFEFQTEFRKFKA